MLWSWASRNRSSEEPVLNHKPHPLGNSRDANQGGPKHEESSLERFYSSKGATDSKAGPAHSATPWDVSSYPSYHQVPSLSQGTESSQQTASFSDTADKPSRDGELFRDGPRLAASAVFPLRAAATNCFLSKLTSGGRAGEDREVSSGRRERDQVAPVLVWEDFGCNNILGERQRGQPVSEREEWEVPRVAQPFLGATRIRLERHLSTGSNPDSPNPSQGLGSLGSWALQHASGTTDKQEHLGVLSLCAINPAFLPEGTQLDGGIHGWGETGRPNLDGEVPVMDLGRPASPEGYRKRPSFEKQDGGGDDRAVKFLRRSEECVRDASSWRGAGGLEINAHSEYERIWGRQASLPQQRSLDSWATAGGDATTGVEGTAQALERSYSAGCASNSTAQASLASPKLRRAKTMHRVPERQAVEALDESGNRDPSRLFPDMHPVSEAWAPPPQSQFGSQEAQPTPYGSLPNHVCTEPASPKESFVVRSTYAVAFVTARFPSSWSPGHFLGPNARQIEPGLSPMDFSPLSSPLGHRSVRSPREADSCPRDSDTSLRGLDTCPREADACTPMDVSEHPPGGSHPTYVQTGTGGVPVSEREAFLDREPGKTSLVSQVSLSHWAGLSLDLACLKETSSSEGETPTPGGSISPLELSSLEGPSTTPVFSGGAGSRSTFRDAAELRSGGTNTASVLAGVVEKWSQREAELEGGSGYCPEPQRALPSTGGAVDVSSLLSVVRKGLKRQGGGWVWTGEERNAIAQLAHATSTSEAYVQSVKEEGGLNLMIKLLNSGDNGMVEAASEVIANCNGAFQAKPTTKAFEFAGGVSVKVREVPFAENGLGCKVWKAAVLLGNQLAADPSLVAGKSVLEIGSGCGLCGFVAAKVGARGVTLTDNTVPLLVNLRESVQTLLCESALPELALTACHIESSHRTIPAPPKGENEQSNRSTSKTPSEESKPAVMTETPGQMPEALLPHPVKSGLGFMVCALKNRSQGLGFSATQPTSGAPKTTSSQATNRPQGLGFGDSGGLGSSDSKLLGGPDQTRRSNLLHAHPRSPTTAFNSLSFRSPPLGPQPFSKRNPKPLPNPDANPPKPLHRSASSAPWTFVYKKEGSVSVRSGGFSKEGHGQGLGASSEGGYGQGLGVSSKEGYGQGLGVLSLGSGGPTETRVRVRQLKWEDELEMLEKVGRRSVDVQPSLGQDATCPERLAPDEVFDVIVGSDCLYNTSAIDQLSAVIKRRMSWPHGQCLLTSPVRDEVMFDDFRKRLEALGLEVCLAKLVEESVSSREFDTGGTFHNADYYAGGFVSLRISHSLSS